MVGPLVLHIAMIKHPMSPCAFLFLSPKPMARERVGDIQTGSEGAKTPSFAGAMSVANSIATDAGRDVSHSDVWVALEKYDPKQFLALCEMYRIAPSSA